MAILHPTTFTGWGDSITFGTGATGAPAGSSWPNQTAILFNTGGVYINQGIGGETSTQITARCTSVGVGRGNFNWLEMGRNDVGFDVTTIMANLESCVRRIGGHVIVSTIVKATGEGATVFSQIDAANLAIKTKYRERVVDIATLLWQEGAPTGSSPDATAYAQGTTPAGLTSSGVHPNNAGYLLMAGWMYARYNLIYYDGQQAGTYPRSVA